MSWGKGENQGGTGADGDEGVAGYHHHIIFHTIQSAIMVTIQYPMFLHDFTPPFPIPKAWLALREDWASEEPNELNVFRWNQGLLRSEH